MKIIKRNRSKAARLASSILLEVVFAVGIYSIYLLAILSGFRLASQSSDSSFLSAASSQNARMGMEKIAACPFDLIVATNWPATVYKLQIPEHFNSIPSFSTNFYLIKDMGLSKIIIIQNVYEHLGSLRTNEMYYWANLIL